MADEKKNGKKRIYSAGSDLLPSGDKEVFEYRRADDKEKGSFAVDLVQYSVNESGLKVALGDLRVDGLMSAVNKALLVKAQGAASAKSGAEDRKGTAESMRALNRAIKESASNPQIAAALALIRGVK